MDPFLVTCLCREYQSIAFSRTFLSAGGLKDQSLSLEEKNNKKSENVSEL